MPSKNLFEQINQVKNSLENPAKTQAILIALRAEYVKAEKVYEKEEGKKVGARKNYLNDTISAAEFIHIVKNTTSAFMLVRSFYLIMRSLERKPKGQSTLLSAFSLIQLASQGKIPQELITLLELQ